MLQSNQLEKNEYYENLFNHAIEQLQNKDKTYLKIVYEAFAYNDEHMIEQAGLVIGAYIHDFDMKHYIRLSEQFRESTSLEWSIDWSQVRIAQKRNCFLSIEDYKAVLILGTFHPNGYYREYCMQQLTEFQDTLSFILLRTNDWVSEVREKAYQLAVALIPSCNTTELALCIQALEKLRHSGRIQRERFHCIEQLFLNSLKKGLPNIKLYQISKYEYDTRKYLYRLLITNQLICLEQCNDLLGWERHSFCKQILITGILDNYKCSDEMIEHYIEDGSNVVRRKAIEYKYQHRKDSWSGLEKMLLDFNRGVREIVAYIIERHTEIVIRDYYTKHLSDANPIVAIIGTGEYGKKEDAIYLYPFLETEDRKRIRAALEALGKLVGYDGYELFLEYLANPDIGISKSAYLAIHTAEISYDCNILFDLCIHTSYEHVRRRTFTLLCKKNSWTRLICMLKLYQEPLFEDYQEQIYKCITYHDMYGKISKDQVEEIKLLVKEKSLPEKDVKSLLFSMKYIDTY